MKFLILIFILSFYITVNANDFANCNLYLNNTNDNHELSIAEHFFTYLTHLHKEGVVQTDGLSVLKNELEKNQIELNNPFDHNPSVASDIHRDNIIAYLKNPGLDRKTLLNNLNTYLKELEQSNKERTHAKEKTQNPFRQMRLHRIEPGSYKKNILLPNNEKKLITVTLTHPFEMMDTHVTQKMWVEVMKYKPDSWPAEVETITMNIDGKNISFTPDKPITNIRWWDAIEFANELSRREGLKPAYITDHIQYQIDGGSRYDLDYMPIKINSESGSIYDTEGYRLPTYAEQEFIRTARGAITSDKMFPGINRQNLNDFVWQDGNSGNKAHSVAELKPFVVDGQKFFDLYGNVYEWSHDLYSDPVPADKTDPQGPSTIDPQNAFGLAVGGNCSTIPHEFFEDILQPDKNKARLIQATPALGLRLVKK